MTRRLLYGKELLLLLPTTISSIQYKTRIWYIVENPKIAGAPAEVIDITGSGNDVLSMPSNSS